MDRLTLLSPAKINLFLDVRGRRPDGYHELVTLFECISLADTLTLSLVKSPGIRITSNDPAVPCDETNLAHRAAALVFGGSKRSPGCHVHIRKVIPVGGGLGGGSSNAAAVLVGLNRLLKLKLQRKALMKMGLGLGSDVAFFLSGHTWAVGRGRGEVLRPVVFRRPWRLWHVLFFPPVRSFTAEAYRAWDEGDFGLTTRGGDVKICLSYLRKKDVSSLDGCLFNRLSEVVYRSKSSVSALKLDLCKLSGGNVHMSGSGTTLFSVHGSRQAAERLARHAQRRLVGACRVRVASTLKNPFSF